MKWIASALIILSTTLNSDAMWQETDKQKHFGVSAAIGLTTSNVAYYYDYDEHHSFWIGLGAVFIVGLGKELYDSRGGGTGFDMDDMAANMLGGAVGSAPVFVIYKW